MGPGLGSPIYDRVRLGRIAFILLTVLVFLTSPATADRWEEIQQAINQINQQITDIQQRLQRMETRTSDFETAIGNQADIEADLGVVEVGINQIMGKIEEYSFQVSKLTKRIDSLEASVNRLSEGYQAQAMKTKESKTSVPAIPDESLAELVQKIENLSALLSKAKEAAEATPTPWPEPPKKVEERGPDTIYLEAFSSYQDGEYDTAISHFKEYLRKFPDTEQSDNAQYWIGMSYFGKGDHENSIQEMEALLKRFPQSIKVPTATLKMAEANIKLERVEKGKTLLQAVLASAPGSEEAEEAERMLNEMEKANE